jgi:hypothetical protein
MKGNVMPVRKLLGYSAAAVVAVGAMFASIVPTQATMYPVTHFATQNIHHVDCAAGFRLGPIGTCIIGTDDPRPAVVEHRDDNGGCETKSVTKQDSMGNSETKTKTNC